MKIVEKVDATRTLADYAEEMAGGPVVVTNLGRPIAVLLPISGVDLETFSLSMNQTFLDLIERSRVHVQTHGSISADEMRRKFQ